MRNRRAWRPLNQLASDFRGTASLDAVLGSRARVQQQFRLTLRGVVRRGVFRVPSRVVSPAEPREFGRTNVESKGGGTDGAELYAAAIGGLGTNRETDERQIPRFGRLWAQDVLRLRAERVLGEAFSPKQLGPGLSSARPQPSRHTRGHDGSENGSRGGGGNGRLVPARAARAGKGR